MIGTINFFEPASLWRRMLARDRFNTSPAVMSCLVEDYDERVWPL